MTDRTKRALADALKELMEKKPLSRITVTDLARACEINRHTFYYHFKDMYDLVEWIYLSEVEKAVMAGGPPENWTEWFQRFFQYARDNKKFVMSTYESMQKEYLLRFMYTYTSRIVGHMLSDMLGDVSIPAEQYKFITDFYAFAFVGVIFSWIGGGMKQDSQELIRMLGAVMKTTGKDSVLDLLEK